MLVVLIKSQLGSFYDADFNHDKLEQVKDILQF